jgi:SOS-response transcriptional repressor LexA
MWPYFDNDSIIVIDITLKPQNRSFVLSHIADTDEIILRQLLIDVKSKVLVPINTAFKSITMSVDDSIIGTVIHVEKNFQYK